MFVGTVAVVTYANRSNPSESDIAVIQISAATSKSSKQTLNEPAPKQRNVKLATKDLVQTPNVVGTLADNANALEKNNLVHSLSASGTANVPGDSSEAKSTFLECLKAHTRTYIQTKLSELSVSMSESLKDDHFELSGQAVLQLTVRVQRNALNIIRVEIPTQPMHELTEKKNDPAHHTGNENKTSNQTFDAFLDSLKSNIRPGMSISLQCPLPEGGANTEFETVLDSRIKFNIPIEYN